MGATLIIEYLVCARYPDWLDLSNDCPDVPWLSRIALPIRATKGVFGNMVKKTKDVMVFEDE